MSAPESNDRAEVEADDTQTRSTRITPTRRTQARYEASKEKQNTAPESPAGGKPPQAPPPSVHEISGGQHGQTYMGGQFGQYIGTQVIKTYNTDGGAKPEKPAKEGTFQVSSVITVHEDNPISETSRIFNATLHSKVTGDRKAAVKITPAKERNYREAKIHFSVPHHENIVERIATDIFIFRGLKTIFIAMERCDCNLYDHVKSEKQDKIPFDSKKYIWIAYQILKGLDFLHSKKVVHGDFKPANVLLILNGNIIKLSDFGLSKPITEGKESTVVTSPQAGTMGWQAPEVLKGVEKISTACDIFPGGLTLYFVWSHGEHSYGIKSYSLNHNIAEGINQDLSKLLIPNPEGTEPLLKGMLENDPAKRPTVKQILEHEIFDLLESRPPKVTEAKLCEILNNAVEEIKGLNEPTKKRANTDQKKIMPLGVDTEQLSRALKSVFETKKIDITGARANRVDDAQVAKVFHQALRLANNEGAEATNLSKDPVVITPGQIPTALQAYLERNDLQIVRKSSGPQISPRTTRSSSVTEPKSPFGTSLSLPQPPHHSPSPVSASDIGMQPQRAETSNASASPRSPPDSSLLHRDCDLLLISPWDDEQHLPELTSKIFGTSSYNGKREFMKCDGLSYPWMKVQRRLSNIAVCEEGITMVLVAWGSTTSILDLLEEKLWIGQLKGLKVEMQNIRQNLAVFAFQPRSDLCISQHSAKISVNIMLSKDKNDKTGELQETLQDGRKGTNITFHDTSYRFSPGLQHFLRNSEVMEIIKRSLHGS